MTIPFRLTATAFASLLMIGAASAQTPAPTTSAPPAAQAPASSPAKTDSKATEAKTTDKATTKKPRTAASLECSKEADGKGIHGKERKKFMSECKKAAADKPKA
jgi:hypothetical protein